jgi:hypothetical protein
MDKIKNSSLYKKAENMVGAGQHDTTQQTAGHHPPGYGGANTGNQQSGMTPTQSGAYPGAPPTHGTDNYSGATSTLRTDPFYTGGVGSGACLGQQQNAGLGGMQTSTYPTQEGALRTDMALQSNYENGSQYRPEQQSTEFGVGVDDSSTQPSHQGGVIGGVKETVGSMTGANQRAGYNNSGGYGTAEAGGAIASTGVSGARHHTGHLAGVHDQQPGFVGTQQSPGFVETQQQPGYAGTQQLPDYAGTQQQPAYLGTQMQPGHLTAATGANGGPHAAAEVQKPSITDRAKGMVQKAKVKKAERKAGDSSSSSSDEGKRNNMMGVGTSPAGKTY